VRVTIRALFKVICSYFGMYSRIDVLRCCLKFASIDAVWMFVGRLFWLCTYITSITWKHLSSLDTVSSVVHLDALERVCTMFLRVLLFCVCQNNVRPVVYFRLQATRDQRYSYDMCLQTSHQLCSTDDRRSDAGTGLFIIIATPHEDLRCLSHGVRGVWNKYT